tara:strand:+ start:4448 stop:7561 length:3114 start_codon:yes stop_codon:yes gene_type:complete
MTQLTPSLNTANPFQSQLDQIMRGIPRASQFGTTLDLTRNQKRAERATVTELKRNTRLFQQSGRMEEFEQFANRDGDAPLGIDTLGNLNARAEKDVLPAVFDMLSIGNYTTVGFLDELVETGDVWEAFKQAGVEFAAALPGIEEWAVERGAKKRGFVDTDLPAMLFGDESNDNGWANTAVGMALDMILDPINLIPGGALLKGATAAGRAAKGTSIGTSVAKSKLVDSFGTRFIADYQLKQLGVEGRAFMELEDKAVRMRELGEIHVVESMERMFAHYSPQERALMGLAGDQKERFHRVLDDWHLKGKIDDDRYNQISDFMFGGEGKGTYFEHSERLWKQGQRMGFFDPGPGRDFYIHGTRPILNTSKKANKRVFEERGIESAFDDRAALKGGSNKMTFAQSRKSVDQIDRVTPKTRNGVEMAFDTEFDLAAITTKRTLEQTRATATQKFIRSVLSDGNISTRVGMDKKLVKEGVDVPIWTDRKEWKAYKDELLEDAAPGHEIYEWKRPAWGELKDDAGELTGEFGFTGGDEIAGAFMMPTAIVERLNKADELFGSGQKMSEFWQGVHKWTSAWKGLATFSPGFHSRNMLGVLANNHLAGVGVGSPLKFKRGADEAFKATPLLMRHAQAMKLQLMESGRPGGKMPKAAEGFLRAVGLNSWDQVPMPKVRHPDTGKLMTDDDLLRESRRWGVSQMATKIENSPEGFEAALMRSFETGLDAKIDDSAVRGAAVSGDAREALGNVGADILERTGTFGDTMWEKVKRGYKGTMEANRDIGMISENNGRMALWLDRVDKGATFAEARIATSMTHYDYRKLTDFEKKYMRALMPFYAWQRFNTPKMFSAMLENPAKMASIPKLEGALSSMSDQKLSDVETPDYFSEIVAAQTPFFASDQPIFATPDLPMLDMGKLNRADLASSMNPFIKLAVEEVPAGGTNLFTGGPLERFSGESDEVSGLSRRLQHAIESILPPVGTFITRPARASARGGAEGLGLYAASQLGGVKLRAVDVPRTLRGNKFRLSRLSREFKKRLQQEEEGGNT